MRPEKPDWNYRGEQDMFVKFNPGDMELKENQR